jgi:hypothetical protein
MIAMSSNDGPVSWGTTLDEIKNRFRSSPGRCPSTNNGGRLEVVDPWSAESSASCAKGGEADIDLAIQAARRAFRSCKWRGCTGDRRATYLLKPPRSSKGAPMSWPW